MKEQPHKTIDVSHPLTRKDNYGRFGLVGAPSERERSREENLADWLGSERVPGIFAKWHAEPKQAGPLVDAFLKGIKPTEIDLLEQIRQHWEKILGADGARQFVPLAVKDNILSIGFFNAAWRFAMDTPPQKLLIRQRIEELTGTSLGDICFVPTSPKHRR